MVMQINRRSDGVGGERDVQYSDLFWKWLSVSEEVLEKTVEEILKQ